MCNLLKQLEDIFNTPDKWNYYQQNFTNPFNAPVYDSSKRFIKEFLKFSEKSRDLYDKLELLESSDPFRYLHIVINYFLGILIYENNQKIKRYVDKQIRNYIPWNIEHLDNTFKYFWFLICFYHDVGYYYELNRYAIKDIRTIKRDLNIKYRLSHLPGVPKLYENVRHKYLRYSHDILNHYDHGIIGGMVLYDKLNKIFNYKQISFGNGREGFEHNGLFWSESMIKYFKIIASVITAHNIWFINETKCAAEDIFNYKNYDLEKLILSNSKRIISLEKYPLFFLLCLVDSIEPTKRKNNSGQHYGLPFLEKIKLIFLETNAIIVKQNNCKDSEVEHWFNNIMLLSDWLKIEIKIVHDPDIQLVF